MNETFDRAVDFALKKTGKNFTLKPEQRQIIWSAVIERKDVLGILPTGFGKSLVFHLLSDIFDYIKYQDACTNESVTIVISPLNALMNDQIGKLSHLGAFILDGTQEKSDLALSLISQGKLQLFFSHPEVLIEDKAVKNKLLKSEILQRKVKVLVVDEAHLVDEWKDFRPAFSKLSVLCSMFPKVPIIALTATATPTVQSKIIESVGLNNPVVVKVNPDRPNIYFESHERPNIKEERNEVLFKYVKELKEKRNGMPLTIFYGNLECCAESFIFFSNEMGDEQYEPIGAEKVTKNRLFTQFHAQYPKYELERIMEELVAGSSKHRVFFVTVAFGIGIDCSGIRRVIHLGVPLTMEEYYQEAGRAGRDGLPAQAIMYYNSYDISKGKKGLQDVMKKFTESTKSQCKREIIMNYFGYSPLKRIDEDHNCCDFHKYQCPCSSCDDAKLIEAVKNTRLDAISNIKQIPTCSKENTSEITIDQSQCKVLKEKLLSYRETLGSNRSCVGSVTFSTGFSLQLIDMVVEHFEKLDSVDTILKTLPVFSEENAVVIFQIIREVLVLQK